MTQKLFYEDSFMKTFSAQVLECCPDEEGYQIVLDRTAFFPEGGGQYADRGHLNQICVTTFLCKSFDRSDHTVCRLSFF